MALERSLALEIARWPGRVKGFGHVKERHLQAALGLEFRPDEGQILLRNPFLPQFLDEVLLRDLRLGSSSVDLSIRRHGDDVALHVVGKRGQIQVTTVLD